MTDLPVDVRSQGLEGARWSSGIEAAIGARDRGSRPEHYLTIAATLDKSLTSHCL